MSHTPGPWHLKTQRTVGCIYHKIGPDQGPKSALVVVMVDRATPSEPSGARIGDARLIAAAPALLAACKAGLARIESDIESPGNKTRDGDLLRAAIASAEPLTADGG